LVPSSDALLDFKELPDFELLIEKFETKVSGVGILILQDPLKARELQIAQLFYDEYREDSNTDKKFNGKHKITALTASNKVPEDNKSHDIKLHQLQTYLFKAVSYVLNYFAEYLADRWMWLARYAAELGLDGVLSGLQTIYTEVDSKLSQVSLCFQKIHEEVKSVLKSVPDVIAERIGELEKDIRTEFTELLTVIKEILEITNEDIGLAITSLRDLLEETSQITSGAKTTETPQILIRTGPKGDEVGPNDTLGTQITISRDQTRSSDFDQVKLLVLRSRLSIVTSKLEKTTSNTEAFAIPTLGLRSLPPPILPSLPRPNYYNLPSSNLSVWFPVSSPVSFPARPLPTNQRTRASNFGDMDHSSMSSAGPTQSAHLIHGNESIMEPPVHDLLERISLLEKENRGLKSPQGLGYEIQVVYCIHESPERMTTYVDEPTWVIGPRGEAVPKAHFPIPDVKGYLQQKHGMAFSVQKHYNLSHQEDEVRRAASEKRELPKLRPFTEYMLLESQDMRDTFKAFVNNNPLLRKEFPDLDPARTFAAPYLFWYHHRSTATSKSLSEPQRLLLLRLTRWIDGNYGELYDRVEEQLDRRVVSYDSMPFLVKVGDAIVVKQDVGQQTQELSGAVAKTYLTNNTPRRLMEHTDFRYINQSLSEGTKKKQCWDWVGDIWSYRFDGTFYKQQEIVKIKITADDLKEETNIEDLNAFPIRYASEQVKVLLEKRGREFWKCREKRLVAYHDKIGVYGV
jgi:hypothetical protein